MLLVWNSTAGGSRSGTAAALQSLMLVAFVSLHASLSHGWLGFGAFAAIALTVAFGLEANSIANGFPFGFFAHNVPGPRLLEVPLHVPLAYVVLGWIAWTLARTIVRRRPGDVGGSAVVLLPILAALILTGFDYCYDAIGSTVKGLWTYRHPSGQFGVPLTNFLGWVFTGWLFFQLFALVEGRFPPDTDAVDRRGYRLLPSLVWGGMTLQFPLLWANVPAGTVAVAGRSFMIADIYEASVIAALLTMVPVALAAAAAAITSRPPPP